MLSHLAEDLIEALPDDAFPGEGTGGVVTEMICGTIATAVGAADPAELERATELMDRAMARTIEHLQLAHGLSRRLHGEDGGPGRVYG